MEKETLEKTVVKEQRDEIHIWVGLAQEVQRVSFNQKFASSIPGSS